MPAVGNRAVEVDCKLLDARTSDKEWSPPASDPSRACSPLPTPGLPDLPGMELGRYSGADISLQPFVDGQAHSGICAVRVTPGVR